MLIDDLGIDVSVILKIMLWKQTVRMHSASLWSTWSPEGCSGEHVDQQLIYLAVVTVSDALQQYATAL